MIRTLSFFISLLVSLSAQETPRQTTEARLWLQVPAGQAPLHDIQVSSGSAAPAPWENHPLIRERHIDVVFPVTWWDWNSETNKPLLRAGLFD